MNEDSQIIMSNAPHEVHIPEGSHTAVHKTAQAQAPVVRNTDVDVHASVEHVSIAQGVSVSEELPVLKDRFVSAPETLPPDHTVTLTEAATLPDTFISDTPPPAAVSATASASPAEDEPVAAAKDVDVESPSPAEEAAPSPEEQASVMAEMNFPARVVKLKIENDKIRNQIDSLEKPLFPPMVEAEPASKGKDKDKAAKKPAKGH